MLPRLIIIALFVGLPAAALVISAPSFRPAVLAICGGVFGLIWAFVEFVDERRAQGTRRPNLAFMRFSTGLAAFGCLAASQVWTTLKPCP